MKFGPPGCNDTKPADTSCITSETRRAHLANKPAFPDPRCELYAQVSAELGDLDPCESTSELNQPELFSPRQLAEQALYRSTGIAVRPFTTLSAAGGTFLYPELALLARTR